MAIVRANYITRGSDPRTAAKKALRAAKYYTERDGPDRDARLWHTSDGQTGGFDEMRREIYALGRAHPYTYRIVLSIKAGDIGPAGYRAALGGRFERYFFVEHHNTDYPHAHVIGYTARRLSRDELRTMRARVLELEQQRAQGQEQTSSDQMDHHARPERARERGLEQS